MFCGRLEARFPGWAIKHTARPGFGLAEPCKSRLFPALTVHSRPPFPFTFCFLPPVNSGGAVRAVFTPVGFRDKHSPALRTAFQIPVPVNLCFQRPVQRQDRPAEPFAADGECEHLRTDTGVAIIQRKAVAVVTVAALPAYQAVGPLPLRRGHAVGGAVRPVFQRRQVLIGLFFHAVPPFSFCCRSPRKGFLPHSCGVFRRWRAHLLWSRCPEAGSRRTSPAGVFLFRRSFGFQGACPSMNYLKSTLFRPSVPYIQEVGNQPGKLTISTLSDL